VGISRNYSLKTRSSKQPTGKISGYEIIPSHPLKYPRSKQDLSIVAVVCRVATRWEASWEWPLRPMRRARRSSASRPMAESMSAAASSSSVRFRGRPHQKKN
jgi:hypothetical protein